MHTGQVVGTEDTTEATSLSAQEVTDTQEDMEEKPEEDAAVAVIPSQDAEEGEHTVILM